MGVAPVVVVVCWAGLLSVLIKLHSALHAADSGRLSKQLQRLEAGGEQSARDEHWRL